MHEWARALAGRHRDFDPGPPSPFQIDVAFITNLLSHTLPYVANSCSGFTRRIVVGLRYFTSAVCTYVKLSRLALTILIIDDDEALLAGLADMLKIRLQDVQVDTCGDPVLAVGMARQHDYDLILCDVCMPGISGLDLLPQLRYERPNVAIIAMSGVADKPLSDAALLYGATAFLAKPFEREILTTVIKATLAA
jgi:CheY-like chemotaxis protein